jgi:flagellar basal-body rod modification protein FlgD
LDLPTGASGVQIFVQDKQGRVVKNLVAGPQLPGVMTFQWNGKDAAENPMPTGLYSLSATAVVNGQNVKVPVSTLSTVRAISTNPADGSVSVEVDGGKTMLLTDVKRVGS